MLRKITIKTFVLLFATTVLFFVFPTTIQAQVDYQCVGEEVADYMNVVIDGAGNLNHIKLLSPAFSMNTGNQASYEVARAMTGTGRFGELDGIAGNAYNLASFPLTSFVNDFMTKTGIIGLNNKVLVTETGAADGNIPSLASELQKVQNGSSGGVNYIGALFFNGFGSNPDPAWVKYVLTDSEIRTACSGTCKNVGVNSAAYFSQPNSFYDKAQSFSMGYTLEIASNDTPSALAGIRAAHARGLTPVIRIGVQTDSGGFDDPADYVAFLQVIDSQVSQSVYAIAGPNEPDAESWASSDCGAPSPPARPLNRDFIPGTIDCDATVDQEFHPLRPYPGNPCDKLIPQSRPPATAATPPDYEKFITYSCGPSLTPQGTEGFNPYGNNQAYQGLSVDDSQGNSYQHTVCDNVDGHVTCYRSSSFDLDLELGGANLGILGNTQDSGLTDEEKVNNYLAYYLTGVPQITDRYDQGSSSVESDDLLAFAGPLRKLLPWDLQNAQARGTIAQANSEEVHNYVVGCKKEVDTQSIAENVNDYFETLLSEIEFFSAVCNDPSLWQLANPAALLGQCGAGFGIFVSNMTAIAQDPADAANFAFTVLSIPRGSEESEVERILENAGYEAVAGELSKMGTVIYEIADFYQGLEYDESESCDGSDEEIRLANYVNENHLPPRRDNYADSETKQYLEDVYSWRGFTNTLLGRIDIPFVNQSIWATLFQNIPLTSLEDTVGEFIVTIFNGGDHQDPDVMRDPNNLTAPAKLVIKGSQVSTTVSDTVTPPSTYLPPTTATPGRPSCDQNFKILTACDSLTAGYGSTGYRKYLSNRLLEGGITADMVGPFQGPGTGYDSDHGGVGGEGNYEFSQRVGDLLTTYQPNVLLLHCGTNYVRSRTTTTPNYPSNIDSMRSILDTIRNYNQGKESDQKVKVLLSQLIMRYDGLGTDVTNYNNALYNLYRERITNHTDERATLLFVDAMDEAVQANEMLSDGIHPNPDKPVEQGNGYYDMAQVWYNNIRGLCTTEDDTPTPRGDVIN